jgi:hypothetical protein
MPSVLVCDFGTTVDSTAQRCLSITLGLHYGRFAYRRCFVTSSSSNRLRGTVSLTDDN